MSEYDSEETAKSVKCSSNTLEKIEAAKKKYYKFANENFNLQVRLKALQKIEILEKNNLASIQRDIIPLMQEHNELQKLENLLKDNLKWQSNMIEPTTKFGIRVEDYFRKRQQILKNASKLNRSKLSDFSKECEILRKRVESTDRAKALREKQKIKSEKEAALKDIKTKCEGLLENTKKKNDSSTNTRNQIIVDIASSGLELEKLKLEYNEIQTKIKEANKEKIENEEVIQRHQKSWDELQKQKIIEPKSCELFKTPLTVPNRAVECESKKNLLGGCRFLLRDLRITRKMEPLKEIVQNADKQKTDVIGENLEAALPEISEESGNNANKNRMPFNVVVPFEEIKLLPNNLESSSKHLKLDEEKIQNENITGKPENDDKIQLSSKRNAKRKLPQKCDKGNTPKKSKIVILEDKILSQPLNLDLNAEDCTGLQTSSSEDNYTSTTKKKSLRHSNKRKIDPSPPSKSKNQKKDHASFADTSESKRTRQCTRKVQDKKLVDEAENGSKINQNFDNEKQKKNTNIIKIDTIKIQPSEKNPEKVQEKDLTETENCKQNNDFEFNTDLSEVNRTGNEKKGKTSPPDTAQSELHCQAPKQVQENDFVQAEENGQVSNSGDFNTDFSELNKIFNDKIGNNSPKKDKPSSKMNISEIKQTRQNPTKVQEKEIKTENNTKAKQDFDFNMSFSEFNVDSNDKGNASFNFDEDFNVDCDNNTADFFDDFKTTSFSPDKNDFGTDFSFL